MKESLETLLQEEIAENAIVEKKINEIAREYKEFLKSKEKQRIIFAADYVLDKLPISIILGKSETSVPTDFVEFDAATREIFWPNRINRNENKSITFDDTIDKVPPKATAALRNFRKDWPNGMLNCDVQMEILQGRGNPMHLLVRETYYVKKRFGEDKVLKSVPFAEVWTVNKFSNKNTQTALIPYVEPVPVLRKVA